jgi:hypothetical protein
MDEVRPLGMLKAALGTAERHVKRAGIDAGHLLIGSFLVMAR